MSRYIRGNVDEELSLGTLAARTLIGVGFDNGVDSTTLVSSISAVYSISDWTPGGDIGPVLVGISHGDYSDAEIQAYLDATQSWNSGDLIAQEINKRRIRRVGILISSDGGATNEQSLNDGKPIKTKLNWTLNEGQGLRLWAFNMGSAAFATTDPSIHIAGHANLWVN